MNKITLADVNICTACGACTVTCPSGCIKMVLGPDGVTYPTVEAEGCVGCGKCMRICHIERIDNIKMTPKKCFAAWNTDSEKRRVAASGGIATAVYEYALKNDARTFGVTLTTENKAEYIEIKNGDDIARCRNSKYVYSDISVILKQVREYVEQGARVILPALPCQAAAVRAFVGNDKNNLVLIDIVCHGVCPSEYLEQHIATIEKKKKTTVDNVSFRDPDYGTNKFVFSLKSTGKTVYHSAVRASDTYQIGYHSALIYRDNCYSCKYATHDRCGDLTISDFSGLGRIIEFAHPRQSVSCVLVNSDKGAELLDTLCSKKYIEVEERPLDEALKYEKQLNAPSVPHKNRKLFISEYKKSGDFDSAAKKALYRDIVKNTVKNVLHINKLKAFAAKIVPAPVKRLIKRGM